MRIRHLQVERFRGIRTLDWPVDGDFVCLIGPGDSTKTTILDAIDYALSSRWNLQFDDTDFFDADTSQPLRIVVTVGDIPDELKSDSKYGLLARGWSPSGELHDEPADGDEVVLSISLIVDASLEPVWSVINDRIPAGIRIGARDREKLACARLGETVDRHFSWGRGSVLSRLTDHSASLSGVLAAASRAARAALTDQPPAKLKKLQDAACEAERLGKQYGVATRSNYRPCLDSQAVSIGVGGFTLHDGDIPLRKAGLGSRRLLAVAMQREATKDGGVALVDELEHGLEPHRLRRVVRVLREAHDGKPGSPLLMTTHSPTVLAELSSHEIRIVRTDAGATRVLKVDNALHPVVLKWSEAFFARKVIVCEGKTELGLCRRLDEWWSTSGRSFGLSGVGLVDGGGSEASRTAKAFADMGYEVSLLADSDEPLAVDAATLQASGVVVIQWEGGFSLEQRVASDLPWSGVSAMVGLAMDIWGEDGVRNSVAARLQVQAAELVGQPDDWLAHRIGEVRLRAAIGRAAKDYKDGKGWFKRVELAELFAAVIIEHFPGVAENDLWRKISVLKTWTHGNE